MGFEPTPNKLKTTKRLKGKAFSYLLVLDKECFEWFSTGKEKAYFRRISWSVNVVA